MAVKTITFPRTAVRRIKYTTGELVATLDADGAVYCSAEQHHMAQWVFDLTAFQAERGLRQIIVSSVTVTWYTSAKYTYNIYFQTEPVLAKSQGNYVGGGHIHIIHGADRLPVRQCDAACGGCGCDQRRQHDAVRELPEQFDQRKGARHLPIRKLID